MLLPPKITSKKPLPFVEDIDFRRVIRASKLKGTTVREYINSRDPLLYENWQEAVEFVYQNAKSLPSSAETFKQIHRIITQDANFNGYEKRRIRKDYLDGKKSLEEALKKYRR